MNQPYPLMELSEKNIHIPPVNTDYYFLQGGGEMGRFIRSTDWSKTPIGQPLDWPDELRSSVSMMLNNLFPIYIAWGPEFTQLYNDGFRPILGATKHPQAMGISTRITFAEIWETIGPMFSDVMHGQAVRHTDLPLFIDRNGYPEECFFDYCYSPIKVKDGSVGGVLVTVIETTDKVNSFNALKEATQQLERSKSETENERDRLRRFFMQAPAGVCILDGPDFVFDLINPAYQQLFPGRDLLGKALLDAVPEIKQQPIWDILQGVYSTGKTYEGNELLIPLAYDDQGPVENRYFNFTYQARHNADGRVDGVIVFVYEVTEMVAAKRKVEESEKRFRSMIEQAPVALLVNKGDELVFDIVNKPMIDLLGKGQNVIGKAWHEAIPELVGQPIVDRLYYTYRTGEECIIYEEPIVLTTNGVTETRYFNLIYKPFLEDGQITGLMQSAVEVTEQVKARKELEEIKDTLMLSLTAAELGTFDVDLIEGTMDWDARCRTLFGISHNNPVTYEHDFVMGLHPDDRQRIMDIIDKNVYNKAVSNGNYDVQYRTVGFEDNKLRWIRAKGKAYFDENDRPVRFIGAALDITEQKTDELRKNDFIGMVSHELKTPLTSLTALVQVLQVKIARLNDEPSVTLLDKANKQVKKMSAMINSFLNVSRLESGKILVEKQDFNLVMLIAETVTETQMMMPSHQISLSPCEPMHINADKDKIGAVISNLLSNAVKYSPRGKSVLVDCKAADGQVKISVTDEGMGIRAADVDRIFERYYRVESHHRDNISGFGIGLYLSAEIIKQHGGEIGVITEPGKGSTFWFTLPA